MEAAAPRKGATQKVSNGGAKRSGPLVLRGPNAPKRPLSAFLAFSVANRTEFSDSKRMFGEIGKLLGERWRNMSEEEREPYIAEARASAQRYATDWALYVDSEEYRLLKDGKRPREKASKSKEKGGAAKEATDSLEEDVSKIPDAELLAASEWKLEENGEWKCEWDSDDDLPAPIRRAKSGGRRAPKLGTLANCFDDDDVEQTQLPIPSVRSGKVGTQGSSMSQLPQQRSSRRFA